MINAIKLYTGPDNASHMVRGKLKLDFHSQVESIFFKESPPHATYDWHNAPITQYVITLSGTLEFSLKNGETFIVKPGDVLIACDTTGSGHRWRLIDDEPWRRAYIIFKATAEVIFEAL